MHDAGFLHRDITPDNFLITKKNVVYMIDLELAYAMGEVHPSPPFALGTPGFMSPEQRLRRVPTIKEDIYGLGALLLSTFTNLPPLKFDVENPDVLRRAMSFLGVPKQMLHIIQRCLSEDKNERPDLSEINLTINKLFTSENKNKSQMLKRTELQLPSCYDIDHLLHYAFKGLIDEDLSDKYILYRKHLNAGLTIPVQGILYTLAEYGVNSNSQIVHSFFKKDYEDDCSIYQSTLEADLPGLFCGLAGNALGLYCAFDTGIIPREDVYPPTADWFRSTAPTLGLADGISGQALAAILILQQGLDPSVESKLKDLISLMLSHQTAEGSWPLEQLRLADGSAGVLFSLIKYYKYRPDEKIKHAIRKGLDALTSAVNKPVPQWRHNQSKEVVDVSLMGGISGIALIFLYGYELLNEMKYKVTADKMLTEIDEHPNSFDFSLESGLAGVGVAYTEAARITGDHKWKTRISWIYHLLDHMKISNHRGHVSWNMRGLNHQDASLLSGNAGIIYFLIRLHTLICADPAAVQKITLI
ncbi:Lanthionine synthetase C-like protein [Pedobacter hartonius]|uniref:Lanthionine synthetase C-like protein n=2 Tax=Pedobacter hartonius TaxID=425514 RepID=A0A1H4BWN5_9SPHI|nr:Lanthionine synthetase C-like protein [Pedobacter hartonius]